MIPGPDQIIACPLCKGLAKYGTLTSGNTFGARTWTDGKQIAPMLPQPPSVVKCWHCGHCFWLGDAEEIGQLALWGNEAATAPAEWRGAEYVQEPSEEEYYDAIRSGLARDPTQERNLRVFAWWRGNEAFRDLPPAAVAPLPSGRREENLQALLPLLSDADVNDLLMKAEASRELGRWAQALEFLDRVSAPEYTAVVAQMRALCQAKDPCVREFKFGA